MDIDHVVTTLYTFCGAPNCPDGSTPLAALVQGPDGNFYGTTSQGGTGFSGTIFKITPAGAFASLHSFCQDSGCPDGSKPSAALAPGSDENSYGTAAGGGASGFGTTFVVTTAGALTVRHTFTGMAPEGGTPLGGLVQGVDGNFYGTTQQGGLAANNGTIFQMDPAGVLFNSWDLPQASGSRPTAALIKGSGVSLFGVAPLGGATGDGTVFEFSVGSAISGLVTLAGGSGLSGVTMTISLAATGAVLTDASGHYSFTEANGGKMATIPSPNRQAALIQSRPRIPAADTHSLRPARPSPT